MSENNNYLFKSALFFFMTIIAMEVIGLLYGLEPNNFSGPNLDSIIFFLGFAFTVIYVSLGLYDFTIERGKSL